MGKDPLLGLVLNAAYPNAPHWPIPSPGPSPKPTKSTLVAGNGATGEGCRPSSTRDIDDWRRKDTDRHDATKACSSDVSHVMLEVSPVRGSHGAVTPVLT